MLATAVTALPADPGWAFEFKWDGVRGLLDIAPDRVRILSRAGNEVSAAYPELVAQAADAGDVLLDGEIVAFDPAAGGRPSFGLLQTRMHVRTASDARRLADEHPVTFVAFDILRRWGVDLTARPYTERRATLDRFAAEHPDWTVSPWFDDGPATRHAAREHGLEGVVAKRLTSPYRSGLRHDDWRKVRFTTRGEFVVVGWEAPAGARPELSSLVLACYADGVLTYAGKAGSGLSGPTARRLHEVLTPQPQCPLEPVPPPTPGRVVSWVRPEVVVEVEYADRTPDGRLRHPVFRGVRTDKSPEEATGDG